mgnify:CR=1 FL=1
MISPEFISPHNHILYLMLSVSHAFDYITTNFIFIELNSLRLKYLKFCSITFIQINFLLIYYK